MHPKMKKAFDSWSILDFLFNGNKGNNKLILDADKEITRDFELKKSQKLVRQISNSIVPYIVHNSKGGITYLHYDDFREMLEAIDSYTFFTLYAGGVSFFYNNKKYCVAINKNAKKLNWKVK